MRRALLPLFVLMAWATAACSSDSGDSGPDAVPTLELQSVEVVGVQTWRADSESLEVPCDGTVPVLLTVGPGSAFDRLGEWTLKVPGACDGDSACGYLRVTLSSQEDEPVHFDSGRRLLELSASDLGAGSTLTVEVELLDDNGELITVDDVPASAVFEVPLTQPTCP